MFVLQAVEQGVEVVVAEARIFERVVEVSRSEDSFALRLVELEEGEEAEGIGCRQAEVEGVGEVAVVGLIDGGVALCGRFGEHGHVGLEGFGRLHGREV